MNQSYRHTHIDLDNVHLVNGFVLKEDPDLGECAWIEAFNEMNDRLREIMIVQAPYFAGAQLGWLRTEMGVGREALSRLLGVSTATITAYESQPRTPVAADFDDAFRTLFCSRMGLHSYVGTWAIDRHHVPYTILLAVEGGRWVGHIAS